MMRTSWPRCCVVFIAWFLASGERAAAQYAAEVLSYDAGTTPAPVFGTDMFFDDEAAPLGEPSRFTPHASFPGVVSPFNPPFLRSQVISIGESGQLTLRLSHYAIPQAGGPEIGVFTNTGVIDAEYPNGRAGSPPATFGVDAAIVEVSENGVDWVGLGSGSPITFDVPTSGYTDLTDPFSAAAGSVPSDFQQPFTGNLSSFDGLAYFDVVEPDMLDLLAGSGGGAWLDISTTGLAQVGFIRLSVADDLDANTGLNFELDAISIAHTAVGAATVPEPASVILVALAMISVTCRRSRAWSARAARFALTLTRRRARSSELSS